MAVISQRISSFFDKKILTGVIYCYTLLNKKRTNSA